MIARLKKILASRYFGVLTMLPTPGNATLITYSAINLASVIYQSERVNEGLNL